MQPIPAVYLRVVAGLARAYVEQDATLGHAAYRAILQAGSPDSACLASTTPRLNDQQFG